jgi:hypothetical protein
MFLSSHHLRISPQHHHRNLFQQSFTLVVSFLILVPPPEPSYVSTLTLLHLTTPNIITSHTSPSQPNTPHHISLLTSSSPYRTPSPYRTSYYPSDVPRHPHTAQIHRFLISPRLTFPSQHPFHPPQITLPYIPRLAKLPLFIYVTQHVFSRLCVL